MQSVWRDSTNLNPVMKSMSPEESNDWADASRSLEQLGAEIQSAVVTTPATALSHKMDGKLKILIQSDNDAYAGANSVYGKSPAVSSKTAMPPVPQTQLRMRRVNSTPCVSSTFSDSSDPLITSTKSSDNAFGDTYKSNHEELFISSPKTMYLANSPMKLTSPNYASLMDPSPTLNTVASTVMKNFPTNNDKISTESILKSAPPTPFPDLDADHAKLLDASSYMMSPSAIEEKTPRSSDPAFSWFSTNSPSLKSPKIIANESMFSGNFFSDAADLGFADKQQSPAPYLKQNVKLPFSPVSTRGGGQSNEEKNTDVTMDAAERDVMEDEDLCLLIKLAHSQGVSCTRTPSQRTTDNNTSTTTDILAASSLHLPLIPSVSNNNAFRASKKDDPSNSKSEWQPPLLKPSGSFHSTKITRMDSYGTSGVAKLSLSASRSIDATETTPEVTKSSSSVDTTSTHPSQIAVKPSQPFMCPTHQSLPFHAALPGGPSGFIRMPPMGYPVAYCSGPTGIMPTNNAMNFIGKKKSPAKKRSAKSSKNKTPSKKRPSQAGDNAEGDAGLLRGVTMRPSGKWQAQLYYAGKSRYIGVFDTRENAATAYEIARQKLKNVPGTNNSDTPNDPTAIELAVQAARTAAFEGVNMSLKK